MCGIRWIQDKTIYKVSTSFCTTHRQYNDVNILQIQSLLTIALPPVSALGAGPYVFPRTQLAPDPLRYGKLEKPVCSVPAPGCYIFDRGWDGEMLKVRIAYFIILFMYMSFTQEKSTYLPTWALDKRFIAVTDTISLGDDFLLTGGINAVNPVRS